MKQREVCYLMSGRAHLPYLVVSLFTLREHWHGPVRVFAWPESIGVVETIAEDHRLDVQAELSEPEYRGRRDEGCQGKNDQFIHKIRLFSSFHRSMKDVETVLYLDADTSVHGDLKPLFRAAEKHGFCATQFCSWTTEGRIPKGRIERLKEIPEIDDDCTEQVLSRPWPSVNGGVWAANPESSVFDLWEKWTWAARHQFVADEVVLHILQAKFSYGQIVTWPDGRFNCSCNPKWFPKELKEEDIVVFHYHGDHACRPDKFKGAGVKRWWPMYQECLRENIGGIAEWGPSIENKWMKICEEKMKDETT